MVDQQDILLSEEVVSEPADVRSILLHRVADVLSSDSYGLHVARLVMPVPPMDAFAWLRTQRLLPRIYWCGRDDDAATAAAGSADACFGGPDAGVQTLRRQLDRIMPHSDTRARYFGGFRFDRAAPTAEEWSAFGTFTFTLPRFEYVIDGREAVLACNLILPYDAERVDTIRREIESLTFPNEAAYGELPLPVSRNDRPGSAGWRRNVEWALDAFRSGGLQKVVLARRADFEFAEPLDPFALLRSLRASTANSFYFGFQLREGEAFIGATPERLFRRAGRRIWTEAVAGTRPRGDDDAEDRRLFEELVASDKEQREHAFVRDSIRESLGPLCDTFHIDPVATGMKLARGWHLVSRSTGSLKTGVHGSEVMAALHPTPAVGGSPTGDALEAIRHLEPFDRGWYAGPVGWIGAQGAEFAVALRCGLVRGDELSLYSGAGIVDGSDPEAERDEIEQKISDFIKVFGLEFRAS